MTAKYEDPTSQVITQLPPGAVSQSAASSGGGFMNWVKSNKLWVAIGILVLIALIWWFCIRKKSGAATDITVTNTPDTSAPAEIKITKLRPGALV